MCSVMPNTSIPQSEQNIFQRQQNGGFLGKSHGGVWQDKNAQVRTSAASIQPPQFQPPDNVRTHTSLSPKRHGSNKRRTVQVFGYVRKEVAAEIERLRDQGGRRLSRSAVVAALLEKAIRGHIDMQYGALLVPVIEQAINARLKARDARFAALLVRIAHDAGQTRSLVTNLLARAPGVTAELLETILDRSADRSKANLTHLSPQITELMQAVEQWMAEAVEEGRVPT
jgi:hypothetical protein